MSYLGASDGLVEEFSSDFSGLKKLSARKPQTDFSGLKRLSARESPGAPEPIHFAGKAPEGFLSGNIFLPIVGNVPALVVYGGLAIAAFLAYKYFKKV